MDESKRVYNKGQIKLASSIVVEDCEGKILLTLRAKSMRVFPNCWVMPGGHIDPGESLEEGVIRELFEETGIEILRHPNGKLLYHGSEVDL